MARNKGTFKLSANYEVQMQAPIDPRVLVDTKADLLNKETWPYIGDTLYIYNGLTVAVLDEQEIYMLVDKTNALTEGYIGWKKVSTPAQTIKVIDNLTTDSSTDALSAKQGKILGERVTSIEAKLSAIFTYKGSKNTYEELPTEGNQVGDVWNVVQAYGDNPAGTNYVWDGSTWDALGGALNLENYYTKDEVDSIKQTLETKDSDLEGQITQLRADLTGYKVKDVNTTESSGIKLNLADSKVGVTVNTDNLASALVASDNLTGNTIRVGAIISDGVNVPADSTIVDALTELGKAIETAQAGSITSIGSTDNSILVSGESVSRDLKVNFTKYIDNNSAVVLDSNGKLILQWLEI